jgi:hypothetical protein
MQSEKQMQEEADKGIKRGTPENPDSFGNRKIRPLPRIRLDVPIRAAARPRPVRALVLKLAALHASC